MITRGFNINTYIPVQVALLLWSLLTETQNLNWQLSTSYAELLVISHPKNMVWKGISGSWIWPKYGAGFRKNTKYLGGKRDLIATREAGCGIFSPLCREREIMTTQCAAFLRQMRFNKASVQLCLLSTEQNIYSDLVNDCLTEIFKKETDELSGQKNHYFNQMPRKGAWRNGSLVNEIFLLF